MAPNALKQIEYSTNGFFSFDGEQQKKFSLLHLCKKVALNKETKSMPYNLMQFGLFDRHYLIMSWQQKTVQKVTQKIIGEFVNDFTYLWNSLFAIDLSIII